MSNTQQWKKGVDYPEWMIEEGLKTLQKQHLLDGETPEEMYKRVSSTLADRYLNMLNKVKKEEINKTLSCVAGDNWFYYMWKGWLSPSTPILSNVGTNRGLGISCFIERLDDTLSSIYEKTHELAMLTKAGGGVGVTFDKVRGRGEKISTGGFSEGVIPFIKIYDSAIVAASQGNVRRGAASINLPIRHKDVDEFLNIRLPEGDVNRQSLNLNHCVTVDDFFMEKMIEGDFEYQKKWTKVLSTRIETGQPYIMYYHNAHNQRPEDMKKRNLKIDGTNICSEIMLPHDSKHTVVCDLASLNISKYDEWKNDEKFIEFALLFLDVNLEEFIIKAENKKGFENAVRFAKKSRSLGLGWLGFHTYLQQNNIPFTSLQTRGLIHEIGSKMELQGKNYNKKYGKLLGNPEWCDENRNLTLFAVAPTTTTALVMGGVSQSIEPIIGNTWNQKSAKGTFIRRNSTFENLMKTKYSEHNTYEVWNEIETSYKGSVQHLDFLTEEEKEVFLTAYEINQLEHVKQIALLQTFVDQGISLNLFFPHGTPLKWINKIHITAWEKGIKSLYYVRGESISSKNMRADTFSDCLHCEG